MRFLFVILFGLIVPLLASAAPDEIDHFLSTDLPKYPDTWSNGLFQMIDLPPYASPTEIVEQIAKYEGHGDQNNADQFRGYHIVQTKQVVIPGAFSPNNTFMAVLIASAKGSKTVILMYYLDFDSHQSQQNGGLKITLASSNKPHPTLKPGWWHRTFYVTTVP